MHVVMGTMITRVLVSVGQSAFLVLMLVRVCVLVLMAMDMLMFMSVGFAAVRVLVGMTMYMFVSMLVGVFVCPFHFVLSFAGNILPSPPRRRNYN